MIACSDDSNHIIRRWNAMDELDDDIDDRINDHLIRIADNNDDANDDANDDDDDDDNDNEYDPDHIIGDPDHIIECIVTSTKKSHHHEIYENEDEVILAIDNGYSGVVLASSSSSSDNGKREQERDNNMVVPQHNAASSSSSNKCVLPRGRGMVPYDDDNHHDNNGNVEMLLLDNKLNKPNRIVGWNDIHGIVSLPVVSKIGSSKQKQEKENDDGSSTIDRRMVAYDEDENGNEIIVSSSNNKCVLPRGRGMVPYVDDDNNRNDHRRSVHGMVPSSGGKGDKNNLNNERKGKQQQQRGIMVPIMSSYEDGQDHYPVDIDVDDGSDDVIPSRPPLPSLDDKYWNDENGHQWKVWNPLPLDYQSPTANATAKPAKKSFPFNPNAKTFTPSLGGGATNNPSTKKKKSSININNSNNNNNDKKKNKNDKNTIGVIVKRSNLKKSRQAKANHQNKENNNNNSNNISSNNKNNSNNNSNNNNHIGVIVKRSNLKKDRQRNSSSSSRSNSNSYVSINNDIATNTSTSTSGGDDDVVVDDSNNHSNNSNNNNKTTTPTSNNNNTVSPSNSIYSSTNFDLDSDEEDNNTEDNDDDDDVLLDDDINDNIDASRYTRSIHSMPVLEEVTEEESPLHSSSVKNSNKKHSDKYCHPFSSSSSSPSLSSSSLGGGSSASEIVPTTSASSKGSSIANNNTGGSGDVDDEAFFQSQREQVSARGGLLCVETASTHSQSDIGDDGSDASQCIKINDVEKGMMVKTFWNDKMNGRQLLKDDDNDNDDDVERKGKARIPIVTPWFRRKDFITIALIILIGIIVGCIAFLTLYLTVVEGGKSDNLGLISSEESESSAEESSSLSNNGEFVSPWSDTSPPIDTTIDNGSNVDTDEDFGITTTVSTTASEEGRDNDNTSGTSTPVVVEEATTTSSPTSTPIDNDSNVDTDEDFSITTTVSTTTPSDEEGRDNDKTSGTSTPVIVVVEGTTTTTTASSPTPSPIQQIVPSQQPVIVATDTITDSSTPSTTTNGNINGGGDNNSNSNSTNKSRLIPVIKDTAAIQDLIKKVRRQIELLIFEDDTLIGSFLRLVFHDCVGGCDGCIDLTNPENNGLDIPINTLQPIVDEFTNVITTESSSPSSNLLSRTDIWMLSSLVATEIALPFLNNDLLFPLHWIGRQTCEQKYSDQIEESVLGFCGLDFFGTPTKCAPTLGPHIKQPHGSLGTQSIQDFFEDEFNFNPQQITALMGAHSVGRMHRHNSGFDGTWDLSAGSLDGGYWLELIGDPPDYFLESITNTDLPEIPDRKQWRAIINHDDETDTATVATEQKEQKTIAMLNVDIALVKNVLDMDETTGDVGCGEVNNQNLNDCSDETPFWPFANVYNGNNRKFLMDFRDVLNHLIDHGYNDIKPLGRKTICPNGRVCTFGFTHSNNDPTKTDSDSETVVVAIVEELSPPPTPSPSRSPPRIIPWVTNGPKIEIDRLCYDTVGENLVVTYNLFLEKQDRSVTDITIQVFDMNNIEIVMLENEKEQDIILNPRVSNDPLLSSLSCGEDTCHTWTSRGGLQMSTTNLIGNGQDYGVLLLANTSPTTDDANANINNDNFRLEILAGVSFRLGGCNE